MDQQQIDDVAATYTFAMDVYQHMPSGCVDYTKRSGLNEQQQQEPVRVVETEHGFKLIGVWPLPLGL